MGCKLLSMLCVCYCMHFVTVSAAYTLSLTDMYTVAGYFGAIPNVHAAREAMGAAVGIRNVSIYHEHTQVGASELWELRTQCGPHHFF